MTSVKCLFLIVIFALPALADEEAPPPAKQGVRHIRSQHPQPNFWVQYEFNVSPHALNERNLGVGKFEFVEMVMDPLPDVKTLQDALNLAKRLHAPHTPFNRKIEINRCKKAVRHRNDQSSAGCKELISVNVVGYKIFWTKGKQINSEPLCTDGEVSEKGIKTCQEKLNLPPAAVDKQAPAPVR